MKVGARDVGQTTTVRTFLIADVRGYTRFTRERGDAEAARLAKKFADLARDSVEARGGRGHRAQRGRGARRVRLEWTGRPCGP